MPIPRFFIYPIPLAGAITLIWYGGFTTANGTYLDASGKQQHYAPAWQVKQEEEIIKRVNKNNNTQHTQKERERSSTDSDKTGGGS
jgi:hypothetical protein